MRDCWRGEIREGAGGAGAGVLNTPLCCGFVLVCLGGGKRANPGDGALLFLWLEK